MDESNERGVVVHASEPAGIRAVLLALFFLSGACGLVYEVVWMRMLTLVFGATTFAASTILAAFFTGLALGGAWFGRVVDRGGRPLRTYGLLEAGIGLFAFLMPVLLTAVTAVYVQLARWLGLDFIGTSAVRLALTFAVLLLPAILMGGTLPAMVKHFARSRARLGRDIGRLYALNTLGALTGALLAGFVLILAVGVREAAWIAGALNLGIAGIALLVDRRLADAHPEGAPTEPASAQGGYASGVVRLVLVSAGLAGFCALALEVFWTRALVFFLDNSTHAFTTILASFLLGIGLGSLVVSRIIDGRHRLLGWLGAIEVLVGFSALLALPVIARLTPALHRLEGVPLDSSLAWKWMGVRFATVLLVVLVPTFLMGMAFPLAARICGSNLRQLGAALGNVYAVNTLGGVLGSLAAGFVLIPVVGLQRGILAAAGLNVLVGVVLILSERSFRRGRRVVYAVGSTVAFLAVAVPLGRGGLTLTSYYEGLETDSVLAYEEGIGATVKVYRDIHGDRILSINGFPVAGEPPEYQDAQKGLAHFPLLLTSVESPTVAIVGFGAGGTSWSVLRHQVERVDCVELVPAVPRQADYFRSVNHGVLGDPRFNLIPGDGRTHALVSNESYDVISVDATSPKMAGNGSLYTREFYELLDARLSDGGIAVQWIPHHLLSDREVRMTIRSLLDVFPHASLWFSPLRQNMVLMGGRKPLEIDYDAIRRKLEREAVARDVADVNLLTALDFVASFVTDEEGLEAYVGSVPANTDNHPVLEFTPAMAYFVGDLYRLRNLLDFREVRKSPEGHLTNLGSGVEAAERVVDALRTRFDAVSRSLDGDIFLVMGERRRAMEEYRAALRIDPSEQNWLNTVGPLADPSR